MPVTLLNENQQRRLATHLSLLASDLETLAQSAELQATGPAYARVREAIATAREGADRLRDALALPTDRAPSLKRRIAAVAEVWAVRMEDLRARRLKSYGAVHPELAPRLDPRVEEVRRALEALADAAVALPGSDR
jgi:hypothetical protein